MTEKQLKHLKRAELIDVLFFMRKELDRLHQENEELKVKLENISNKQNTVLTDEDIDKLSKSIEQSVLRYLEKSEKRNNSYEKSEEEAEAAEDFGFADSTTA
ncbi:MAG: hypothetical protein E7505_05860 [Ruminococcus sp.]|nr:hypothetical protein [Ruminococcus sp.]